LVEYSLILALVAAGLGLVLLLFRDTLGNAYGSVGNRVDAANLPVASPGGQPSVGSPSGGSASGGKGKGRGKHGCGGYAGVGEGCGDGRDQ
jgi:hypothetical protein